MKASVEILTALAALEHDFNFKQVRQWLAEELADQDAKNRATDAPEVFRGQGRSQILADFLQTAGAAQENLESIGQRERKAKAGYPQ